MATEFWQLRNCRWAGLNSAGIAQVGCTTLLDAAREQVAVSEGLSNRPFSIGVRSWLFAASLFARLL
jgi:hypothetical protein